MTKKRLILALVVALIVSGLFTYFLSRRVAKTSRVNTRQSQFYVTAAKPLEAGEVLKQDSMLLTQWYASTPLPEGISKMSDLVGRITLYPMAKGELIIERELAGAGSGAGLTANIPSGMRAIAVRTDEFVGVAGFLLPGTHVDVLMTYRPEASTEPRTATVLQNVVVIAAGQQIHPDPAGKPVTVNVVTLLLEPEDAEKIVLATSLGGMYFVLRNGADVEQADRAPIGLSQLAGNAPISTGHITRLSKRAAIPSRSEPYQVETFLGNKRVTADFN